jgi:hypothetical protein
MRFRVLLWTSVFLLMISGCSPAAVATPGTVLLTPTPVATNTPVLSGLWIAPSVPDALRQAALVFSLSPAADSASAAVRLEIDQSTSSQSTWVYALVAPFPAVADGVSFEQLKQAWAGQAPSAFAARPLVMAESTYQAMKSIFGGETVPGALKIVAADEMVNVLWQDRPQWGIVPFESLDPKMKVLEIDGQSPIQKSFNEVVYPLKVAFDLRPFDKLRASSSTFNLPLTNRDPSKLTTVIMTGTSALVRAIAFKMEANGILYPGVDVRDILREADILHVSNEASFADTCPPPSYDTHDLRFCSKTKYIQLFEDVGVDIMEATGNHINNWDVGPFADTLKMYKQHGWLYFGGGVNLADAEKPALMEHNGTKLAFIGCNLPGPEPAFATKTLPGAAPCGDYGWLVGEIGRLRADGYQVIVTQQYNEYYTPTPTENQARDFKRLADAGATIVSGSQAHYPQSMVFLGNTFVHYGLGNLFFDQMSYQFPDTGEFTYKTRDGFLDRHVFYDGKYISTELLTVILEDHSRPRPMTAEEREAFLSEYLSYFSPLVH